jgi:predicted  nucleic acid-binding Zn-ribbon protein
MAKEFLKNLKDLFIVPEEDAKTASKSESAAPPMAPKPSSPSASNAPSTPGSNIGNTPTVGKVNDKLAKLLLDAIEKNNQEGFDYLEFRNSLQSLKEMNMDDTTRMKSAMAMAKSMGASLETIVTSGQHYLHILKGEQSKFADAMNNQRSQQVGNKQQQLQDLEKSVKAKEEQILHLQKEIEGVKKEHLGLQQQIQEATKNIEATRLDFETTYNIVAGQIQQDLTKIQELLK